VSAAGPSVWPDRKGLCVHSKYTATLQDVVFPVQNVSVRTADTGTAS